ncbi:MAG: hypothetical protein K2N32_03795, partial [Clostridia bacterium]|nr:hypothetical protein [Clostridia bacterium]
MDIRKRKVKGIFVLSVSVILLAFVVGIFAWFTPIKSNIKDNAADSMEQSAITELASTTTSYGKFANKSKYTFTDKTKIASYRASEDNTGTDTTTIEVDSSATHGSQKNPYVIDNFAGWTHLVTEMQKNSSSTYTYGQGKYYVLAVDLDFDASGAPAENPLYSFGGTLYGLGHTISNWKFTENTSEEATGLIRYSLESASSDVTVSDLNMNGCEINNAGLGNAAILGYARSNKTFILNCHTKLTVTRLARGRWGNFGGIISGVIATNNYECNATVYRCSADSLFSVQDSTLPNNSNNTYGGIVAFSGEKCNLNIYDCYAFVDIVVDIGSVALDGVFIGGLCGISWVGKQDGMGGKVNISGCVSKMVADLSNAHNTIWYIGGIASLYENPSATVSVISEIENIYVSGTVKWEGGEAIKTLPWIFRNSSSSTTSNKMAYIKSSGDVYYTGEEASQGEWWIDHGGMSIGNLVDGSNSGTLLGTATGNGETQLWTTAKSSTKLKSKIWSQKENIGSTYTIQNSPVINKFDTKTFNITYKDAHVDGTDTVIGTSTYNYGTTPGL